MASGTASTSACGGPPPPPPPGTANLWVDTNGGSCARQASPGAWVDNQACSWNAAYQAAQTGDLILVRGGSYGNVTIGPNKASIAAPGVTFRTATGESVVVGDLENGHIAGSPGGSNISFVGPASARTFRSDQSSNIVVDTWNVDCNGCDNEQIFHLEAANNVTVRNSEVQDNKNNSLMWVSGSNLTFDNNKIHDAGPPERFGLAHRVPLRLERHQPDADAEPLLPLLRDGCVHHRQQHRQWRLHREQHLRKALGEHRRYLQQCVRLPLPHRRRPLPGSQQLGLPLQHLCRAAQHRPGREPRRLRRDEGDRQCVPSGTPCGQGNTTFSYNAFISGACGTSTVTNTLATYLGGFTGTGDPGTYSLKAGSVLRDKGNPANYPSQDRTGAARYAGAAPDLGAYEGP